MPLFINHNVSHTQCEVYMYVYIAEAREWICSDNLPCTEPLPAARRTSSFHVCSPLCDDNCSQCYICQKVVGVLSARVLGNDSEPSSHQLGGLGERCKLRGDVLVIQSFWCIILLRKHVETNVCFISSILPKPTLRDPNFGHQ